MARPLRTFLPRLEREVAGIDRELLSVLMALTLGESRWPLFLNGPAGSGKTCAALWLLDHCRNGKYFTVTELTDALTAMMKGELRQLCDGQGHYRVYQADYWHRVGHASLVVLDEIGCREKVTDHHYEAVKRVLDVRQGLPLIVISNLDLAAVAKLYDDRIASRLAGGTVVTLRCEDRRLSKGD